MTVVQLSTQATGQRLRVNAPLAARHGRILLPEALQFVADLERRFGKRRQQLMGLREDRQRRFNSGERPGFRAETAELRATDWRVKQAPADLRERHVEISGPVEREWMTQALQSGANGYLADFEDAHAPTWSATIEGQLNLHDAVRGTLEGQRRQEGQQATLMLRPRGWHLPEQHLEVDGHPVSASLFDFGLYLFHNGVQLLEQGSGPYFYLPKLESYIEAQLWADVFGYAEESLGLSHGSICCTVQIETVPAAFEMEEILFTLRDYAVALGSGPRDYLFSCIKRFHADPAWLFPDCHQVSPESGFLRACSRLLVDTCQRRGAHAIAGPASGLPGTHHDAGLRADTVRDGHHGIRVAHPALVAPARAAFDAGMAGGHRPDESAVTEAELLEPPAGRITAAGLDYTISAGLRYLAAWLGGRGAVPMHDRMEDVATAEIARSLIWQWIRHPQGTLEDGRDITHALFAEGVAQELDRIRQELGGAAFAAGHYQAAADLFSEIIANDRFVEFLTLPAYQTLA